MIEEIKNQTGKVGISTDGTSVYTVKVIKNAESISEKQSACRGPDKRLRKIDVNSVRNLKPFQSVSDISTLNKYARNPYQKSGSSWKFLIVILIILGIIIVAYLVWKYYKEKRERSYNYDNSLDIFDNINK